MGSMHGTLSTIRGGRATPRFVQPISRGRRRRLGLDRVGLQAELPALRRATPERPIAGDLRGWSGTVVGSSRASGMAALHRDGPTWSRQEGARRTPLEPHRAAPWRR